MVATEGEEKLAKTATNVALTGAGVAMCYSLCVVGLMAMWVFTVIKIGKCHSNKVPPWDNVVIVMLVMLNCWPCFWIWTLATGGDCSKPAGAFSRIASEFGSDVLG